MKKTIRILACLILLVFVTSPFILAKESEKKVISENYQKKAKIVFDLSSTESYRNDNEFRKYAPEVFIEEGYTESDLDELITIYQNPVMIRFKKNIYESVLQKIETKYYEAKNKNTAPKSNKEKLAKEKVEQEKQCLEYFNTQLEQIQSGISKTKNICSGVSPAKLDNADDGKFNYSDNKLFSYLRSNYNSYEYWSKQGNTYTFSCRNLKKTFTYNPQEGSFK